MPSPSSTAAPARPRRLGWRIALGVLAALVVFVLAFDWNWCAPLLRHYVESRSGRRMEFSHLQVRFRHGLDPTIELRDVRIQNAPWAETPAPFLQARRAAATVSWRSIGSGMTVLEMVELEDAQVDMERRADGIRNWRLTRPNDIGPPRVRVLALDARNSHLHTVHHGIGLDMEVTSTPLPAAEPFAGQPALPLTRHLVFKGRFKDDAFDGAADVSDILTFGATPRQFTFRAQARSGSVALAASGLSNDIHALADFDCDIKLTATATGAAKPLPEALARVRPLLAQGHVSKSGDDWKSVGLRLRAGRQSAATVDVAFTGNFKNETPRRTLKATLHDAVIDLDDVSLLRGKTPPGEPPVPATRPDADHALSTQPLPLARLRTFDADVDLRHARFTGAERGLAQTLRGHATLAAGVLDVRGLDAGIADGHVTGTLHVDAAQAPAQVALELDARGLHVEQLSSTLATNGALAGAVDGHAAVRTRGDSSRALVSDATGSVTVSLADGATVSKRLDAKLGLNGGEWLRTLFDKSARVPVQCASVTLALARGVATPKRIVFETPDTALAGTGRLDLGAETLDLTLTPARKKLALLALDKSIHASGSWHDVKVALVTAQDTPPERCVK